MDDREQPLVLAADDDQDILELIVFRLEHSGYTVLQAHDGAEALELADQAQARLDRALPRLRQRELRK